VTDITEPPPSLEGALKDEIVRMYQEVADNPTSEFHFFHGRPAAEMFEYDTAWLDRAPAGAVDSFAGVGNPHLRSNLRPGETVLDLGSGAGLDSIVAGWQVGPTGSVIGLDLNPTMCRKAEANASASGVRLDCRTGAMEQIPASRRVGGRGPLQRRDQPVLSQAAGARGASSSPEAGRTALGGGHRQRQAAVPVHRERPQALGQLNRRRSPEGELFRLLEETGFTRVRSVVVPRFRFRKASTQSSAEAFGVKAVVFTAMK
jgi:hypothetical protein